MTKISGSTGASRKMLIVQRLRQKIAFLYFQSRFLKAVLLFWPAGGSPLIWSLVRGSDSSDGHEPGSLRLPVAVRVPRLRAGRSNGRRRSGHHIEVRVCRQAYANLIPLLGCSQQLVWRNGAGSLRWGAFEN